MKRFLEEALVEENDEDVDMVVCERAEATGEDDTLAERALPGAWGAEAKDTFRVARANAVNRRRAPECGAKC